MRVTLAELAQLVGGTLTCDVPLEISGAATLAAARPGEITLLDSSDKPQRATRTEASAAVVPRGVIPERLPAIQVDDVHAAFAQIVLRFRPPRTAARVGISPRAIVSPTARISTTADIHPGAVIGDEVEIGPGAVIHSGVQVMAGCQIAENVTIFANAVLYENTVVGPRVVIHAGVVLGAYGFGYNVVEGRHQLSAQLGYVEIGADVDIGANSTIDRGTYGPTVIGEGTKIDNLVMIAHNCRLGRHNLICSQVGVAGSTTTGDYVTMAGQAGVRDHVHIGDRAVLGAKAGVPNDVPAGAVMFGIPARPEREQKLILAVEARLPEFRHQLRAVQAAVSRLEARVGPDQDAAAAA